MALQTQLREQLASIAHSLKVQPVAQLAIHWVHPRAPAVDVRGLRTAAQAVIPDGKARPWLGFSSPRSPFQYDSLIDSLMCKADR